MNGISNLGPIVIIESETKWAPQKAEARIITGRTNLSARTPMINPPKVHKKNARFPVAGT